MILANGLPKSGTHLLMKALSVLGAQRCPGMARKIFPNAQFSIKGTVADPVAVRPDEIGDYDNSWYLHSHVCYGNLPARREGPWQHKMVYIVRDPRDVLVSYARYDGRDRWIDDPEKTIVISLKDYHHSSFADAQRAFLPFITNGATSRLHVVRFEEMVGDLAALNDVVASLAVFLGLDKDGAHQADPHDVSTLCGPFGNDIVYKNASHDSSTWTGQLSDWRDHWTPEIDRLWAAEGLTDIESALGYR